MLQKVVLFQYKQINLNTYLGKIVLNNSKVSQRKLGSDTRNILRFVTPLYHFINTHPKLKPALPFNGRYGLHSQCNE